MLRGTWLFAVIAVVPLLISGIAAAAPGYPVENPPGEKFVVAYNETSHILSVTTPSTTGSTTGDGSAADVSSASDAGSGPAEAVGGVVAGPNGQVNHGQVIKRLHELTDGPTGGCLTSAVARSEFGKGEQQVKPGESETTDDFDITTLIVECATPTDPAPGTPTNPDEDQATDKPSGTTKGKPTAKPDTPGKSGDAPGENK